MASKISNGVFIGTCIGAFIGTILCAVYAKVPLAQAPGMGLNAFFAYTVVLGMGYTYHQTLTIVFISGVLFIVITAVDCARRLSGPYRSRLKWRSRRESACLSPLWD